MLCVAAKSAKEAMFSLDTTGLTVFVVNNILSIDSNMFQFRTSSNFFAYASNFKQLTGRS